MHQLLVPVTRTYYAPRSRRRPASSASHSSPRRSSAFFRFQRATGACVGQRCTTAQPAPQRQTNGPPHRPTARRARCQPCLEHGVALTPEHLMDMHPCLHRPAAIPLLTVHDGESSDSGRGCTRCTVCVSRDSGFRRQAVSVRLAHVQSIQQGVHVLVLVHPPLSTACVGHVPRW